jgi:hypothetical protein
MGINPMKTVNGVKIYAAAEIPIWPNDLGPPHGESKYGFKISTKDGRRFWDPATQEDKVAMLAQLTGKSREDVLSDDGCFNSAPGCGGICGDGGICVQTEFPQGVYICTCLQ